MEENNKPVTPEELNTEPTEAPSTVEEAAASDEEKVAPSAEEEAVGDTPTEDDGGKQEIANGMTDGGTENAASPSEFMNIEHFADYRKPSEATLEQINDEPEAAEDTEAEAIEDMQTEDADGDDGEADGGDSSNEIGEFREYENLTILDEIEEEPNDRLENKRRTESKDAQNYDAKKPRRVDGRFDFVELFVCMMVIIMLLSTFVFRHSVVDGGSMESTFYDGEHLIITDLFYEPKQYDIIVCEDYTTGLKKPIIKRVIATEGQTVRVVAMDEVYVDGVLVDTSFITIDGPEELALSIRYPIECVVPEGEVFVMGDHRNNSLDSRVLGTIDEDTILGKVVLRFYPFDRFGKVE